MGELIDLLLAKARFTADCISAGGGAATVGAVGG